MDFNDRRPRTKMKVRAKGIQAGDYFEHPSMPGVMHPVTSASPGLIETARGVQPGHNVTLQSGAMLPLSNMGTHTVHRLNLPTEYGAEDPKPMGDNGGAEVRYNDAAGRRTNPLR